MQALYRRYRPKTFDEVVGQEKIVTALKNQITEDHIHHAYLFSGTRGTGKTSVAKIFARAINCLEPRGANPCNACEVCRGILEESLFDVMEIDAASNNSVDDIREIRENIVYAPAVAKKKVYIVDEVHMLSKGAFNALLKILEEPPAHAVFILATTEPQKIPATILSRSQKFSFSRLKEEEIARELGRILDEEGRNYTEDALHIVAVHGDGSMRDSLSILDQVLSLSEDTIDAAAVRNSLGLSEDERIFRILDGVIAGDAALLLDVVEDAYLGGRNLALLYDALLRYFRELLFYRYAEKIPPRFAEEEKETFIAQARQLTEKDLFRCIDLFDAARDALKYAKEPRGVLEVLLLKTLYKEAEEEPVDKPVRVRTPKREPAQKSDTPSPSVRPPKPQESESPREAEEASEALRDDSDRDIIPSEEFQPARWEEIVSRVRTENIACAALLKDAETVYAKNRALHIGFLPRFRFHLNAVQKDTNRKTLEESVRAVLGEDWAVIIEETDEDATLDALRRVFGDEKVEVDRGGKNG
ncbi:DNA polymerase-3 subunit gamma/tau [Peptoniphilus ivorii]|uniref:DNA polymerase III subunit gamma/tau n=1 Tax=Aedoeadaptatus ivorii TaxID=54006 RepID=UPI002784DEBE|nr:DNA polymerase III subunit gamma/tau [Peptoniphilus ivorii]MDQ0507626.1 DNA polymerase-3 subunit gamma/tau [Peptoniphilus ivorii]